MVIGACQTPFNHEMFDINQAPQYRVSQPFSGLYFNPTIQINKQRIVHYPPCLLISINYWEVTRDEQTSRGYAERAKSSRGEWWVGCFVYPS